MNAGSFTSFLTDDANAFRAAFLMPQTSVTAFNESRKILVLDGAHMRNGFVMKVLSAVGYDAEGIFLVYRLYFFLVFTLPLPRTHVHGGSRPGRG